MGYVTVGSTQGDVQGTSGSDTFVTDQSGYIITGKHTLAGGTGDDVYYVTNATKVIEQSGGGNDTIVSSNSYVLPDNVENLTVWGSSAAIGNGLNNVLKGVGNHNLLDGGGGDDTLTGGGGTVTFQFGRASGHDMITDWSATDTIRIAGYNQFHSLTDVKSAMTQVGNDVVLAFDATDSVKILNTTVASFTSSNFQYTLDPRHIGAQTFDDEFNTFSARTGSASTTGTWDLWGSNSSNLNDHTLASNNEKEIYVDPGFKGTGSTALGLNPYSIQNGDLVITAAPTAAGDKSALFNYGYTSGAVTTQHSFAQTYGYFEARMELPTGQGAWPAFWLLPADGSWPPELDVMEAWNDTTAVGTAHTAQTGAHTSQNASTYVANGDGQMHTYGVLWTPDTLTWYVDGVAVQTQQTPADMHSPMYMIANLAVSDQVQDPNFTAQLKIDYVRAYSLAGVDTTNTAASHPYWGAVAGVQDQFNWAYYAAHNPDVVASGIDLLQHYENYGKREGRLPYDLASTYQGRINSQPDGFNAAYYVLHNPDVAASGLDPLYHYETYGKAEGRSGYDATVAVQANPVTTIVMPDTTATNSGTANAVVAASEAALAVDGGTTTSVAAVSSVAATASATAAVAATTAGATAMSGTATATTAATGDPHSYMGVDPGMPDGFNADYYAAHNPDVVAAGMNLLQHYLTYGRAEGRSAYDATVVPSATNHAYWGAVAGQTNGFNAVYYEAHNPDVAASGLDPLAHYLTYGRNEGRAPYNGAAGITTGLTAAPVPTATTASATATSATTTAAIATPITSSPHAVPGVDDHKYMGVDPGTQDGFNADYYLSHNPDVAASGLNPLYHYETYGKTEGRLAYDGSVTSGHAYWGLVAGQTDGFNAQFYAAHNPDVVAAGMNLFQHYEQYGKAEGRLGYDDGSGAQDIIGTGGNDVLLATGKIDKLMTGGGGSDTFRFAVSSGWNTITDFDTAHDTLDISALVAKYGAPTITTYQTAANSEVHFTGGETIVLLGVGTTDAHHLVGA